MPIRGPNPTPIDIFGLQRAKIKDPEARREVVIPGIRDVVRNPLQRGQQFQRKADINPVIADSR